MDKGKLIYASDAVEYLRSLITTGDLYGMGVQRGIEHAINHLEEMPGVDTVRPRDILMNPVRKYRRYYSDDYCPVCGKQQKQSKRGMEKPWFCERCGQKLGWDGFNPNSETEKGGTHESH